MRRVRVTSVLVFVLVLGFLLGACAPKSAPAPTPSPSPSPAPSPSTAPQPSGWEAVLAAARKEGAVTVYSTSAQQLLTASKEAMSKLGITVQTIGGSGAELEVRIATEQRAKANVADVFTGGLTNQISAVKAGYGQPVSVALPSFADKSVFKRDLGQYDSSGSAFVYGNGVTPSIIVNTDLVRPGEITSWQDLLDPKWRDRMVMSDPRIGSGPGSSGLWIWMTLGEDFWKKMAAQRITQQVNAELPAQQVAYGDKSLAIFPNYLRIINAIKAGAPIQIVHLKEGTSYYVTGVNFVKGAPHPNAALVFLNWMFSKEGQHAIGVSAGVFTVRKDVVDDWIPVKELIPGAFKLIDPPNNVDPEGAKKAAEFAKKIFGAQ